MPSNSHFRHGKCSLLKLPPSTVRFSCGCHTTPRKQSSLIEYRCEKVDVSPKCRQISHFAPLRAVDASRGFPSRSWRTPTHKPRPLESLGNGVCTRHGRGASRCSQKGDEEDDRWGDTPLVLRCSPRRATYPRTRGYARSNARARARSCSTYYLCTIRRESAGPSASFAQPSRLSRVRLPSSVPR